MIMQQYQVPQFITVEDKIFGPLTIKQALYLGAGGGIVFLAKTLFASFIFVPIAIIVGGLALSLAFLRINDIAFPTILKNALRYIYRPRFYIWKREAQKKPDDVSLPSENAKNPMITSLPKMSESRLSDLAWSLDIKEKVKE